MGIGVSLWNLHALRSLAANDRGPRRRRFGTREPHAIRFAEGAGAYLGTLARRGPPTPLWEAVEVVR
eukprot:11777196-Alexandrium_andersonii.AAC.1